MTIVSLEKLDLVAHLHRQRAFSEKSFGPQTRKHGVVDHIRKELEEIDAAPNDLEEWIDVMILAMDGAWRAGFEPEEIAAALVAKQTKNESRTWPDWRSVPEGQAIEHDRSGEPTRNHHAEIAAERDRLKAEVEARMQQYMLADDARMKAEEDSDRLRAALKIAEGALGTVVSYLDANDKLIHATEVCVAEIRHQQSKGIFPVKIAEEDAAWNAADKERWTKLKEIEAAAGNARSALSAIQEALK